MLNRAESVREPGQEIGTGWIVHADSQVQGGLIQWHRDMPPAARDVQEIAVGQHSVPQHLLWRIDGGLYVPAERVRPCHPVNLPVLSPSYLQDEYVVVVPVQIKSVGCTPT